MAKNKVQYQKGLSVNDFLDKYGTEELCEKALFKWRYPQGLGVSYARRNLARFP